MKNLLVYLPALALTLLLAGATRAAAQTHPVAARTTALASATPLAAEAASALPQTVQVRGTVRLPNGKPCPGASVYPAGAPRQLVVTDQDGAFTLPVLVGAPVSLRVEYFGEGASRVELPQPPAQPLSITLGQ